MAATHIKVDATKEISRNGVRAVQMIREGCNLLAQWQSAVIQMRDGDGSSAAHYDLFATLGGIEAGDYADANTAAKSWFDEMDSLNAKVNGNGSTDNVNAAILQANAKLGV